MNPKPGQARKGLTAYLVKPGDKHHQQQQTCVAEWLKAVQACTSLQTAAHPWRSESTTCSTACRPNSRLAPEVTYWSSAPASLPPPLSLLPVAVRGPNRLSAKIPEVTEGGVGVGVRMRGGGGAARGLASGVAATGDEGAAGSGDVVSPKSLAAMPALFRPAWKSTWVEERGGKPVCLIYKLSCHGITVCQESAVVFQMPSIEASGNIIC